MPLIATENPELTGLRGLHLWHAPMSSCSQRVRIVLAETGAGYDSHLVNLEAGEHASAAYQAIHPKGLVPALVDDGKLFVESIDIIGYLARDHDVLGLADADLLALADGAQQDLKLLTFEFLFRGKPRGDPASAQSFQDNHLNDALTTFHRDFQAGFPRDRIQHGVHRTWAGFQVLEARLADGRPYLSGDAFSLSDVAWMPNVHRFALMDWPFEATPHLSDWFDRIKDRPSYREGLAGWQPDGVEATFAAYSKQRAVDGTGVRDFVKACISPIDG